MNRTERQALRHRRLELHEHVAHGRSLYRGEREELFDLDAAHAAHLARQITWAYRIGIAIALVVAVVGVLLVSTAMADASVVASGESVCGGFTVHINATEQSADVLEWFGDVKRFDPDPVTGELRPLAHLAPGAGIDFMFHRNTVGATVHVGVNVRLANGTISSPQLDIRLDGCPPAPSTTSSPTEAPTSTAPTTTSPADSSPPSPPAAPVITGHKETGDAGAAEPTTTVAAARLPATGRDWTVVIVVAGFFLVLGVLLVIGAGGGPERPST